MTQKITKDPTGIEDDNIKFRIVEVQKVMDKDKNYVLKATGSTTFNCISPSKDIQTVIKAFDGGNPKKRQKKDDIGHRE